jgi:1-aminocyclopropane-1-carboxylate deaminase/D-cysteine desulfhydrase-like pyridoxal-dependent ACC family enzyme
MVNSKLLQRLSPAPVLGVSMANITLLRLDRSGGLAPGNKSFKLKANLAYAREYRLARLVSFGGAWSNHLHDHHCGGYARVTPELKAFILEFEGIHKIPLDPVYTGKALFAVYQMLKCGSWTGEITFIHTGGLQGRRGFPWLS